MNGRLTRLEQEVARLQKVVDALIEKLEKQS